MRGFNVLKEQRCAAVMKDLGMKTQVTVFHQIGKVLIDNSRLVANCVFYSFVGHTSLIVDARDGGIYKYDNSEYVTEIVEGDILVRHYGSREWSKVYKSSVDVFDFSEIAMTDGHTTAGGLDYPAIILSDIEIGKCKMRVHSIVFGVVYGYVVLQALSDDEYRTHEIHHINGISRGNGIHNLQLLTKSEHHELEVWLKQNRNRGF